MIEKPRKIITLNSCFKARLYPVVYKCTDFTLIHMPHMGMLLHKMEKAYKERFLEVPTHRYTIMEMKR